MTAPIERLPVEVFDTVVSDLELDDYRHLRLSSQRLYSLTLSTFAKLYLSQVSTTLGSPSLHRLVAVSKHGHFRHAVAKLNIKLLTYPDYLTLAAIQRAGIYPPPKRFRTISGIKNVDVEGESTLYNDLVGWNHPRCITDRLTLALKGLRNLKSICIRALHAEPIGWRWTDIPDHDQKFRRACFDAVLESITKSGIQLEEFSMAKKKKNMNKFRKGMELWCSKDLQFSEQMQTSLQHSFKHLQSLTLSLVTVRRSKPGWETGAVQFIACAANLKHLALSLDRSVHISRNSAHFIHSLATSSRHPALESFQLVNCSVYQTDMEQFATAHAETLSTMTLTRVRMTTGSWTSFWSSLKTIPKLRWLRFGSLEGTFNDSSFWPANRARAKITLETASSGRQMNDLLDELVAGYKPTSETPF
ncbi:hypothetical protein BDU57DRAFT_133289 [Ampelomyces quisqualis]|uniref:F-box domain-containing protein n=1 Tax=Ampelomyces quisqualis TaxID=50730 RepID=A0A6A5QUV8_AMPQU|nr:hypothetical protein BDU57DRAFT_133289 [Ampelomyces quisqualis]